MIHQLPDFIQSKIIFYSLYHANKQKVYLRYVNRLCSVSKGWLKICNDIQSNNISLIRDIGKVTVLIDSNYEQYSTLKNRYHFKFHLSTVSSNSSFQKYLSNDKLDAMIENMQVDFKDLNKIRDAGSMSSLKSLWIYFLGDSDEWSRELGELTEDNQLSDSILERLESLQVSFQSDSDNPTYRIPINLESLLKNFKQRAVNLKELKIFGESIQIFNNLCWPLSITKLTLYGVHIPNESFKRFIIDSTTLFRLECDDVTLFNGDVIVNFEDILENGISLSKSLQIFQCSQRSEIDMSPESIIRFLNLNTALTQLDIFTNHLLGKDQQQYLRSMEINNTTLKKLSCKKVDLLQYWKNPSVSSAIESVLLKPSIHDKEYIQHLNQHHKNCKTLTMIVEDHTSIDTIDTINLPNLSKLWLVNINPDNIIEICKSIQKRHKITDLNINFEIDIHLLSSIVKQFPNIKELFVTNGVVINDTLQLESLYNLSLISIIIKIGQTVEDKNIIVSKLIQIIKTNPLQYLKINFSDQIVDDNLSKEIIDDFKETIYNHVHLKTITTNSKKLQEIVYEYL